MLRLRGKPLPGGSAVSLGSATVLRAPNGIPMLPARLVAQMARARHDEPVEPLEVVLVARDLDAAASLMLPWARVVGIAAEVAREDAESAGIPTVVGIDGILDKIEDDALVLIDGDRGIVLVDPDGMALAAYQAERERIAPRRRIFLDYSHQPAVSLDGRLIHVMGQVETLDDVRTALDNGADALYVVSGTPLLDPADGDEAHLDSLLNLAEAAAGKAITIGWDVQSVAAANLLQAARRAEITLAIPLSTGDGGFSEVQAYLQETREELLGEDIDFADVRLAGLLRLGDDIPELGPYFINRIIVEGSPADGWSQAHDWLLRLESVARPLLLPIEVAAASAAVTEIANLLACGASGVMVAPNSVSSVKDLVRAKHLAAVREELLKGVA